MKRLDECELCDGVQDIQFRDFIDQVLHLDGFQIVDNGIMFMYLGKNATLTSNSTPWKIAEREN